MKVHSIYLDHNAATPVHPAVAAALPMIIANHYNPQSPHFIGRRMQEEIEEVRNSIKASLGISDEYQVIFTDSGTSANKIALTSMRCPHLISAVEHLSVFAAAISPIIIPVDTEGIVDLNTLEKHLQSVPSPALVSIIWVNNETGVVQPVRDISTLVHRYQGLLHLDAVQAYGKIPTTHASYADIITLSSRKMGGITGAAAAIFSPQAVEQANNKKQQISFSLEGEVENFVAITAWKYAIERLSDIINQFEQLAKARKYLESTIKQIAPDAKIIGELSVRVNNTSMIYMPNVSKEVQLAHFDRHQIAVGIGAACTSGLKDSHVLTAMGIPRKERDSIIRISTGNTTTTQDLNSFLSCWEELYLKSQLIK